MYRFIEVRKNVNDANKKTISFPQSFLFKGHVRGDVIQLVFGVIKKHFLLGYF